jgi:hypothetical protein
MWGAAAVALLALPCALLALRGADELFLRRREWARRPLEETQALRELDRAIHDRAIHDRAIHDRAIHERAMQQRGGRLDDAPAQTIDDIARELRRLDRQRRGGPTLESERWLEAVLRAYDDGLCRACRCVGVPEHLKPLEGMDRDIERVRVEGALQRAGVPLR